MPEEAQEARAARVQEATAALLRLFESGELPEKVAQTTIARLATDTPPPSASWSLGNQLLMLLAGTADARGFHQWHEVGRYVNKGAKAFYILAPVKVKKRVKEEDGTESEQVIVVGFRAVPVFRVEDTHGADLTQPDYSPKELPPLFDVAQRYGVTVRWTPATERFRGAYSITGNDILLCTHDVATFFHELAHAVHNTFRPLQGGQVPDQEVVAETVSAVLCRLYGYGGYLWHARAYIEHYAGSGNVGKAIMRVLSDVQRVLTRILEAHEAAGEEPAA